MMKLVKQLGLPLVVLTLAASANQARAEIKCENTTSEELGPHLECVGDRAFTGTTVAFRRIPGWSGNAGMTLIELCSAHVDEIIGSVTQTEGVKYTSIPVQGESAELNPQLPERTCYRRYCTQDIGNFSLFIETVPIPITPVFWLGGAVGFSQAHFSITCDPIEIQGG
jgi:hypothetical protein